MMRIADAIMTGIAHVAVWAGSDTFRWKMKNLGWTGWSVKGVTEPKPEEGYEKE